MGIAATFTTTTDLGYGILATARLVRGDTAPQIRITLKDSDNNPTDLTGCTVTMHVRRSGTSTLLFSRVLDIPDATKTQGVAVVVWGTNDLDQPAGIYEGEVEIVFADGRRETLFDVIQLVIREDFN